MKYEPLRISGLSDYLPGGQFCPLPADCTDAEWEQWMAQQMNAKP